VEAVVLLVLPETTLVSAATITESSCSDVRR